METIQLFHAKKHISMCTNVQCTYARTYDNAKEKKTQEQSRRKMMSST